jgi:putative Ca2+/H+ antiporter (TMEM165/GDT1 family)
LVIVALAEMGDKTQLVAFSLASRYRRPWTVMLGILLATTVNHGLASSLGVWAAKQVPGSVLGWALGLGFIAFGVWTLFPDSVKERHAEGRWGVLASTAVVFFLAEMGDKTQLATVALGARFGAPVAVTAGTTLGMLAADGLAVFGGAYVSERVPMRFVRWSAATLFVLFGIAAIGRLVMAG